MIHTETRDAITILRIDHGRANALDTELLGQMVQALGDAEADGARGIVLTGTGAIFSAGVDLLQLMDGGPDYIEEFVGSLSGGLLRLFQCPLPVVAAINGHAIAGGCILATACDHRVMVDGRGKIGLTELAVGVPLPAAGLEIAASVIPRHHLRSLLYSARLVSAEQALEYGLVDEVAPAEAVVERAVAVAARLADVPPAAFSLTKQQLQQPVLELIERQGALHDQATLDCWRSEDSRVSIAGFLERTVGKDRG